MYRFVRRLVIVPAFNESASIGRVVADLRRHAPEFDLVVIDDGSPDATAAHVPAGAAVIRLPFNVGIGAAMQTGYRYAAEHGYDVAVQVDGDGQHPAEEVRAVVERLAEGDADLVIGSRFMSRDDADPYRQGAARAAGARILRALLRVLAGARVTDVTSGFRAANRAVIETFARSYPDDYPEPEVVLLLLRAGFRVVEVPVRMDRRRAGRSSISPLRGLYYVIKVSVALLLATIREPLARGGPRRRRGLDRERATPA